MVDKIWYDWQNRSPKNKYAYGGGFSEATDSASYAEFPTGLPPYYGVSVSSNLTSSSDNDVGPRFLSLSLTAKSLAMASGMVFKFGTRWIRRERRCAMSMLKF